jgi:hypothetical protein
VRRTLILVATAAAFALLWAPGAQAAPFNCGTTLDTFTRANSTSLGTNWTEQAPDPSIEAGGFTNVAPTTGLATFNLVSSAQACVDVAPAASGVSYAAIVLKYANLATDNVFVKVQDQNAPAGQFDTIFFYRGNNGAPFGTTTGTLTPFSSGRFHVAVNGTTVTADIDTNFDNQPEQTITTTGLNTTGLGTGIGLGAYGHPRLDNFAIPRTAVPAGGNTKLLCKGKVATLVGSDAAETINGTARADVIVGLGGADILRGRGGNDVICGGGGADKLVGGPGKDRLYGQQGKDTLVGGPKNDVCAGGPGKDTAIAC